MNHTHFSQCNIAITVTNPTLILKWL